jgi:hypothetical protein
MRLKSLSVVVLTSFILLLSLTGIVRSQASTPHPPDRENQISAEVAQLIADVRHATAPLRDFASIEDAGYGKFLDCFVNYDIGGMGQHYVNGELVSDDVLDPIQPEALVFEPTADGEMILVAFEYLVFADVWGEGREAPMLFDREFHLKTNIPDTPPVWALHIWLWTHNPEGIFADYNPLVFCPQDQPITDMTP